MSENKDPRWLGLGVVALLVIGASFGRASVDPIYVTETETVVKEVVETEVVEVEVPVVPTSCVEAAKLARVYADAANAMVDYAPSITDAIALARKGMVSGTFSYTTQAENDIRRIDSAILDQYVTIEQKANAYNQAIRDCEEELP